MPRKTVSRAMLILLTASMLAWAFNIQRARLLSSSKRVWKRLGISLILTTTTSILYVKHKEHQCKR